MEVTGGGPNLARRALRWYRLEVKGRYGAIPRPERWAFVVGCSNSGTTLLRSLLGQHPSIGTMPAEGQLVTDQLVTAKDLGFDRLWALHPEHFRMHEEDGADVDVDRIKRQWGHRFNDRRRRVLLDDSPPNAARTKWLQRHFAPASFLFIVRNGFAVADGIRRRVGHSIDVAAKQWVRANEMVLEDMPLLDNVYQLRYEDLTERPDEVIGGIFHFLQVAPLRLRVSEHTWRFHHEDLPIANMNDEALARLSAEDRETVQRVAAPLLGRFGYFEDGS